MEWLASEFIRFWLDSITVYTFDDKTTVSASIVIIGTRKGSNKMNVSSLDEFNLLRFFHEMRYLMLHDQPVLRDVIILDPIVFFIKPLINNDMEINV
jgi:hypothetical protein